MYELSKHREYQNKVREEIKATRARVVAERGDEEITISDLDSMQYLPALMKVFIGFHIPPRPRTKTFRKETLRFHPIVGGLIREAGRDDNIPLSHPVKLNTGEVITSLPIEHGQEVVLSFIAYNRYSALDCLLFWMSLSITFQAQICLG